MENERIMKALSQLAPEQCFLEAEETWAGGIADLGDKDAGWIIQAMHGYFNYRSDIEEAVRNLVGDELTVYRLMPTEQYEQIADGAGLGAVAVSLSKDIAAAFRNTPHYSKIQTVLVSIVIDPSQIVMRGKEEEMELVVDGDWWGMDTVTLLNSYP